MKSNINLYIHTTHNDGCKRVAEADRLLNIQMWKNTLMDLYVADDC